jgi:nucleic acid/nucleotide deaminase of polymorphic system toxin
VASIGEVAAGVRAALNVVVAVRAQLTAGLNPIDAAGEAYARLGAGSSQPDLPTAAAQAQQSAEQIRQAIAILDQATAAAERYLATIVGPAPPTEQLDTNQVDRLRRELPPPITAAERGTGRKTHGRWFGADGVVRQVVSGKDEWSTYADDVFDRIGEGLFWIARHAEMKVGAQLRAEYERTGQPQHATVVLNREPCGLEKGCAALLPVMLPAGCSLTVYAPNYRCTFTGGKTL